MSVIRNNWHYVDPKGNKWSTKTHTEEQANKASNSLINCYNCRNCSDCFNCNNCNNCKGCNNCNSCNYSNDCIYCHYGIDLTDCTNCNNCAHCVNCKDCEACINCRDCKDCQVCVNCDGDVGLTDCEAKSDDKGLIMIDDDSVVIEGQLYYRRKTFFGGNVFFVKADLAKELNIEKPNQGLQNPVIALQSKMLETIRQQLILNNSYYGAPHVSYPINREPITDPHDYGDKPEQPVVDLDHRAFYLETLGSLESFSNKIKSAIVDLNRTIERVKQLSEFVGEPLTDKDDSKSEPVVSTESDDLSDHHFTDENNLYLNHRGVVKLLKALDANLYYDHTKGHIVDNNRNRVTLSVKTVSTIRVAVQNLASLINCTDCTDCINCTDCTWCCNVTNSTNSHHCSNCDNLDGCASLDNESNCTNKIN